VALLGSRSRSAARGHQVSNYSAARSKGPARSHSQLVCSLSVWHQACSQAKSAGLQQTWKHTLHLTSCTMAESLSCNGIKVSRGDRRI